MSREWKPGDVAVIRDESDGRSWVAARDDKGWSSLDPGIGWIHDEDVAAARPLVLIDPEEIPVARGSLAPTWLRNLARELGEDPNTVSTSLENVLRFLADKIDEANPTPPKPDEPTGLGAVVETAVGHRWLHAYCDEGRKQWIDKDGRIADYEYIDAVRVLSEGVTP